MTFETGRQTTADPSNVSSKDDLGAFIEAALGDLRESGRNEWENATLERFLGALAAFAHARQVGDGEQEAATWRLFAEMVVAATGYE